jgi:hypothetical protein
MASNGLAEGVIVEKPRWNVYTMMLLLSLLAIIIACVCLYLELKDYETDITADKARRSITCVEPAGGPMFADRAGARITSLG